MECVYRNAIVVQIRLQSSYTKDSRHHLPCRGWLKRYDSQWNAYLQWHDSTITFLYTPRSISNVILTPLTWRTSRSFHWTLSISRCGVEGSWRRECRTTKTASTFFIFGLASVIWFNKRFVTSSHEIFWIQRRPCWWPQAYFWGLSHPITSAHGNVIL